MIPMTDWQEKLFIDRADLSIRIMNIHWPFTERSVEGIVDILNEHGIKGGHVLDLCCGNGRISVHLARRGFRATGVDFSKPYLEDAERNAEWLGVSDATRFVEGDVRDLTKVLQDQGEPFDAVVSAWTSIGYTTVEDDLSTFRQARQLSRKGSILFIIETQHEGRATQQGSGSSTLELDDMVMLEKTIYDPITARGETTWTFYRRRGRDLEYVDELHYNIRLYSLPELSRLLGEAGWKVEACYGNIATRQAFSPSTSMNIVAQAA
jgi:SAM-dependent methyltransferase